MKMEQLITWFDVVSFIVGIASIVLAIVSLVLSILFYKWGKEASNLSSQLTTNIEAHTKYLKDLFDKMLKTTFEMIRDHNHAMDRKFLDTSGRTEERSQGKIDIEVFSELLEKGQISIPELAKKFDVEPQAIKNVADEINKRGQLELQVDDDKIKLVSRCFLCYSSIAGESDK